MEIREYNNSLKHEWDNLIRQSRNGTFILYRTFIEYHQTRFHDHSLMFYHKGHLLAVLPGHIQNNEYISHAGLTYAGLVLAQSVGTKQVIEIFEILIGYLQEKGITRLIYKPIPHIYHRQPCEEDLYALFRLDAKIEARSISSGIYLKDRIRYNSLRRRGIKKAIANGIKIEISDNLDVFWPLLEDNLAKRHHTHPVHQLDEINYLKKQFPDNISLFLANLHNEIVAGCVIFLTDTVVHIQYIATNERGRQTGATDLLVDSVINNYPGKRYFDYGISTEKSGLYLNENLISQKEGFGARGIIYDIYSVDL